METHSHIGQDLWVAETLCYRRNAFFLDFGAFDGVTASNTFALEQELGWKGIAVDANPTYYPSLCENRSTICVNAALWPTSRDQVELIDAHGLTSLRQYIDIDANRDARRQAGTRFFNIDTINPTELLQRYGAPTQIEYMSLDVEGCELEVLRSIDFAHFEIALITVEHCENPARQAANRAVLLPLGYKVLRRFYDDWFFHPQHLARLQQPGELFNPYAAYEHVHTTFTVK